MRKPPRLPVEDLLPYEWEPPGGFKTQWGEGPIKEPQSSLLPSSENKPKIDWQQLYGNANPVELEVGFGKGLFLVNEAVTRPNVNFFGVEIIRKYQRYASTRIARRTLANCKTCWGDAKKILQYHVSPGTLATVHVFFPDPWWKSRHKKRTLFTTEFARIVLDSLQTSGILHFVTDVADYYAMVREVMAEIKEYEELPPPVESEPTHDMDYLTNFERKFRKEGRPIHRAKWLKRSANTL